MTTAHMNSTPPTECSGQRACPHAQLGIPETGSRADSGIPPAASRQLHSLAPTWEILAGENTHLFALLPLPPPSPSSPGEPTSHPPATATAATDDELCAAAGGGGGVLALLTRQMTLVVRLGVSMQVRDEPCGLKREGGKPGVSKPPPTRSAGAIP
jgi:hypothetical protein